MEPMVPLVHKNFMSLSLRKEKSVQNLFLDNNILSRSLKQGFTESISKVSLQLDLCSSRVIEPGKTILIITPSGMFEYAGIKPEDFIKADEINNICNIEDPGEYGLYFDQIHQGIKKRVEAVPAFEPKQFAALFRDKLKYLPPDSQQVVKDRFIDPVLNDPNVIKRVHEAVTFHLFCGAPILPKYSKNHHVYGVFLVFHLFKKGHIASVAKLLPHVWNGMKSTDSGKVLPTEEKKSIAQLLGMHQTGDFLDSDLVHLATTGLMKSHPEAVHCLTEDPPLKIRQRIFTYRTLLRNLLVRARSLDQREGSRDFKDVDFRCGYVTCFNANFEAIENFRVQKIKSVNTI